MQLEKMMKKTLKAVYEERDRLSSRLVQINHVASTLSTLNGGPGPGPLKGKKLSAAHKRAISLGRKKAAQAKANK